MKFYEIPTVFLSFHEGNADANYKLLQAQHHSAVRVHGVKGFDAAHKAAAAAARAQLKEWSRSEADTPFFLTIDGDNEVFPEFWDLDSKDIPASLPVSRGEGVLSWNSFNPMNGLHYGNGGIKLWSFSFVDRMKTHESTEDDVLDFCWDPSYIQLSRIYSYTRPYGSAAQAFCAGFREGAKMPLVDGLVAGSVHDTQKHSYASNLRRLVSWCSLGAHVENGEYAIMGALTGFCRLHIEQDFNLRDVSDMEALVSLYDGLKPDWVDEDGRMDYVDELRNLMQGSANIFIPKFGKKQSKLLVENFAPFNTARPFEKETWPNPLIAKY